MKNRLGITIRFNRKKQNDLKWLTEFYDFSDPKQTCELAFDQLLIATRELEKKLKQSEEEQRAKQNSAGDSDTASPAGGPAASAADQAASETSGADTAESAAVVTE